VCRGGADDGLGGGALVEAVGAVPGDQPQEGGLLGELDDVAGLCLAVPEEALVEEGEARGAIGGLVEPLEDFENAVQVVLVGGGAVWGGGERGGEAWGGGLGAVLVERVEEAGDCAGDRDRAPAAGACIGIVDVLVVVGRARVGGHLAVVDGGRDGAV